MNKTHYYCDKCKKEVDENELNKLFLILGNEKTYIGSNSNVKKSFELCDVCASKIGLIKQVIKENEIVKESTTAEKLYDIMAQLVYENTNQ